MRRVINLCLWKTISEPGTIAPSMLHLSIRSPSSQILNEAGQSVSIAHLAIIRGFEQNTSGRFVFAQSLSGTSLTAHNRRAYRIGVDVSIWFHHAAFSKKGENAEL